MSLRSWSTTHPLLLDNNSPNGLQRANKPLIQTSFSRRERGKGSKRKPGKDQPSQCSNPSLQYSIDWLTLPKDLKHFITKTIIECHQGFMGTSLFNI